MLKGYNGHRTLENEGEEDMYEMIITRPPRSEFSKEQFIQSVGKFADRLRVEVNVEFRMGGRIAVVGIPQSMVDRARSKLRGYPVLHEPQ